MFTIIATVSFAFGLRTSAWWIIFVTALSAKGKRIHILAGIHVNEQ